MLQWVACADFGLVTCVRTCSMHCPTPQRTMSGLPTAKRAEGDASLQASCGESRVLEGSGGMDGFPRNHLVWIDDEMWTELVTERRTAEACTSVASWRAHRWPLVVCGSRPGARKARVAVGLPAPRGASCARVALEVSRDSVISCRPFPKLQQIAQCQSWNGEALHLDCAIAATGAVARVYGSYGWQALTGEAYVHEASDIDLCIEVPTFASACAVVRHLQQAQLARRLDGELVFAGGHAVAWREFAGWLDGKAQSVLVKSLGLPRLVEGSAVSRLASVGAGD
jgi:phosphoribosyl-dephospho-CoA transferase